MSICFYCHDLQILYYHDFRETNITANSHFDLLLHYFLKKQQKCASYNQRNIQDSGSGAYENCFKHSSHEIVSFNSADKIHFNWRAGLQITADNYINCWRKTYVMLTKHWNYLLKSVKLVRTNSVSNFHCKEQSEVVV